MIEKISKLLNQAENAGTEAEAATFMEKAQQLAATHSVDLAKARHMTISKEKTTPIQKTIKIGEKIQGLKTLTDLFLGIARANDLKSTIAHDGSRVYAVGFREDIDVAEAMFASLMVQMGKALEVFKNEGSWKNEEVYHENNYWEYIDYDGKVCNKRDSVDQRFVEGCYKPITWRTARINFQEAFANRVETRLLQSKREQEALLIEAEEQIAADFEGPTAALVLVKKKEQVDEAFAPHLARARGSYSGGHSGASSYGSRSAGSSAADNANLGSSPSLPGARKALG